MTCWLILLTTAVCYYVHCVVVTPYGMPLQPNKPARVLEVVCEYGSLIRHRCAASARVTSQREVALGCWLNSPRVACTHKIANAV